MLKKYGKFYADWFDPQGRRLRKSFTTRPAAQKFQARMRAEAAAKKVPRRPPR